QLLCRHAFGVQKRPNSRRRLKPALCRNIAASRFHCDVESPTVPVSLQNSKIIYDALKRSGVKLLSALPETWLVHLISMADEDPEMTLVRITREEEAIGISAGAHLAGVRSGLLMQNHGFLAAINPIVSLAFLYKIPLLMLLSYAGHMGDRDPWQTQGGRVTEPLLRAVNI